MASNIEGQAAKSMAGATAKPGRISGIITALFADRYVGRSGKSGSKSGMDYHNEELAKRYDYDRETGRSDYVLQNMDKRPEFTDMSRSQTGFSARRRVVATSSGGQGTSGNRRGSQFNKPANTAANKPKPASKPKTPRQPKPTGPGELLV